MGNYQCRKKDEYRLDLKINQKEGTIIVPFLVLDVFHIVKLK